MKTLLVTAPLSLLAANASAQDDGLRVAEIFLPHHDQSARVAIWYPSTAAEAPTLYADNPVFQGVAAHMDGPVVSGRHPVVLFSHGMGGTDRAQAWLGAALAERGVITVMVNHPNTTWGDFDMREGVAHWTRAQDMSVAMDTLEADPSFSDHLDTSRIMAAGFSFGGWTALSLGGATGNHAGIVSACETRPEMEACGVLMSERVNMPGIDPATWDASYADDRVTHVAALDPGFVWGLEASNVEPLLPSTLIIGFGGADDRMLATDFDRSGLADHFADRRIERLAPAYHFSAMPLCKPAGETILAEENDDPVCTDPTGSNRADIHATIVSMIVEELGK